MESGFAGNADGTDGTQPPRSRVSFVSMARKNGSKTSRLSSTPPIDMARAWSGMGTRSTTRQTCCAVI